MYECNNLFGFFLNFTINYGKWLLILGLNRTDGGDCKGLYVRFFKDFNSTLCADHRYAVSAPEPRENGKWFPDFKNSSPGCFVPVSSTYPGDCRSSGGRLTGPWPACWSSRWCCPCWRRWRCRHSPVSPPFPATSSEMVRITRSSTTGFYHQDPFLSIISRLIVLKSFTCMDFFW